MASTHRDVAGELMSHMQARTGGRDMAEFQRFSRKGFAEARDLEPGEGLEELRAKGVSVSEADALEFDSVPPGKVFRNPENHNDFWYVARAFFDKNYDSEPMR